ncbi:MAG: hypothetical protein O3C40_10265 [Planctomycetota bacterium]|nr:hypothetical protein [Planctomycetota bacterium]
MTASKTQISANISIETKERMEAYTKAFGVKKSHLIESAILHHLGFLEELPADILIPPVVKLSKDAGQRLLERIEKPSAPTDAMKALFDD